MSSQSILNLLSRIATAIFLLLVVYAVFWFVATLVGIYHNDVNYTSPWGLKPFYSLQHISLPSKGMPLGEMYSPDSLVKYSLNRSNYIANFKPRSLIGYYASFSILILLVIMLSIAFTFRRIFMSVKVNSPFHKQLVSQLIQLSRLYIVLGAFSLVDFFIMAGLLAKSFPGVGTYIEPGALFINNFVIGAVIWTIAVIFQRGIELQDENALTV